MKKVLAALMLMPLMALADTWTDPATGITWTYTVTDGKARVGSGEYYGGQAISSGTTGAITIPSTLDGYSVTSIADYAFSGCVGLTSVTIPEGVSHIGLSSFSRCTGLTSVAIPVGVKSIGQSAFSGCSGLKSMTIPSSVTSIEWGAFQGCSKLVLLTIQSGVTSIEPEAFRNCCGLTSVTIPSSVTSIGMDAFYNCSKLTEVTISSNLTSIGPYAFSETPFLENLPNGMVVLGGVLYAYKGECPSSVTIPSNVTSIGDMAFYGLSGLACVTIPSSVMRIGDCAFSLCSGLTSVTIPSSVISIGREAFYGCSGLTEVTIPEGVTHIGDSAFSQCIGLRSVTIPSSVTNIGCNAFERMNAALYEGEGIKAVKISDLSAWCRIAFNNSLSNPLYYGAKLILNNKEVTDLIIPNDVTLIGNNAFICYSSLTSVTIPKGVTSVGDWAFYGCGELASVTIPSSVTNIGDWAFSGCRGLTSVMIPSSMMSIGGYAFYNCSGLTSVTIPSSVTSIGCRAFYGCQGLGEGIVVVDGCVLTVNGVCPNVLNLPHGVRMIGGGAFFGCSGLTSLAIPSSVTSIGDYAFYNCSGLTSMTIPSSVTNIGQSAFSGCNGVKSVTIPPKVTCIESSAFSGCSELSSVTIPESVTNIESRAFYGCGKLTSVIIPPNVARIGDEAFSGCPIKVVFVAGEPQDCVKDYFGEGMWYQKIGTPIEYEWQCYCENDEVVVRGVRPEFGDVVIPSYRDGCPVTSIGRGAFSRCKELTSVTIPDGVVSIENQAFYWCTGLSSVTIPSSVTNIGDRAFYNCGSLNVVYVDKGDVQRVANLLSEGGADIGVIEFIEIAEYAISYLNTKGVANPNLTAYVVTNEVVFTALPDLPDWHFDGWSPAKIDVGTTGDVTVVALWRPIEKAEIVGGWSEPQTFEYDGQVHGVDYSARLDVMDWPLNVVTQGTIRAVNVGEYAATARAETVGVPETDTVYYRCAAVTNDCRWTITPKPVTKLQITYVSTALIANGQPQTPQIVVRDVERGVVLTATDYALAYENNVEPGRGIARITGKGNYGGEATIEFPIVASVSPSEGLNMDDGTFEIVGETDWVADNVETHDGYAAMRSGAIGDGEASALTSVVHGAGTVSFWWKVSSQRFDSVLELDRLEFYIDGERQKWINGDTPWAKLSYKVDGAGPHELKWVYVKDGSVSERQDCGWVDEVTWEKDWLIGDWLNDVDREFTTDEGDSLVTWVPDSSVSADGVGSMRSGACQQGERSVLSTVVENAGELTFKWKSSCVAYGEYVTDRLSLLVDGVPVKDKDGKDIFVNGQTDWREVSYRISGVGRHEVQWVFEKVSDASMGQNCGWVDVVRWNGEPGTLTESDLAVESFDGTYDGQAHGVSVSVKGTQGATVKYGVSSNDIINAASPTFADCGEHEVWFAVNVPEFYDYVGKTVIRIQPRSIETGTVTLGAPLVYTGSVLTQTVSSVTVDGLPVTFEVADNEAREAGEWQLTVTGTGNFCGVKSVPFVVARATAPLEDVTVEGFSAETDAVEFAYDGKTHLPKVFAAYDPSATVRFALSEDGPFADELGVSNAVEQLDVWYEITSANYARLVGRTRMTIHPLSIESAEVVLGEQVSDAEGRVVQQVDSVIVAGLSATFEVADNVAAAEGDFELTVSGTGNFTGEAKCPYSVGGIVLPPVMTPGDGAIITNALTVYITAQTPESKCYYTLDGSMPTTNSLTARRVNLHEKTTIRAMAVLDGKLRSAVVEARYALGACENPKIRLDGQDGRVFHFPEQLVVIDWKGEEGVVRYTVDGSEPTVESPAYEGPFAISETTTVKAKAFSDAYFDSETVTAEMRLEVQSVPSPVIHVDGEYRGTRTTVSLSCALDGAVIRYTLDGSEPTAASALFEGDFEIGGGVGSVIHVKARAFREHYADSPVAEAVVTRIWGIGDTLGVPDMTFETDGWVVDPLETFDGRESMRSGPTGDGETKTLQTVVQGGGTISFFWRTSCEDSDGDFIWDRAEFWVDDECVAKLEGESGWLSVVHEIPDDKSDHRLCWLYAKDSVPETSEGEDCAWLNGFRWLPCGASLARPSVDDDPDATVTGDAETGFVVKPSEVKTAVEVTIPQGVDAAKVTVEVSPKVMSVKPNGAKVKIVSGGSDITEYLVIPGTVGCDGGGAVATQEDAVIDLTKATVKEEIVKEAMDVEKGAVIDLRGGPQGTASPTITTAPTKVGLFYQFREGETLGGMKDGDSIIGNGLPWSPEIKVKGGNSAFYSIGVGKGE